MDKEDAALQAAYEKGGFIPMCNSATLKAALQAGARRATGLLS
jgi:hypothetical protein